MRSATSLAATGLTISALILSATTTPFQIRQSTYTISCTGDDTYVQTIPHSGQSTLLGWCTSPAVSLACDANGHPAHTIPEALKDPHCDVCVCAANGPPSSPPPADAGSPPPPPHPPIAPPQPIAPAPAPAPAPLQPTCTGSMKLKPGVAPGTMPPSLQNWCLRPAINTVCDPGVHVLGVDTEGVCQSACTCP